MTTKRQTLHEAYHEDLYTFTAKAFATVTPGIEFKKNWHLEAIAYHLSLCEQCVIKRLVINIHPRSLKSLMGSVAFPAWVLGRDPGKQIICASYAQELSRKHHDDCRAVLGAKWYQNTFPGTRIDRRKNSETEVATTGRGFRYATSVGGPLTGRGCDILIIDDIQKPEDVRSDAERPRAAEWFDGTALSRLNDPSMGVIIVLTQRLHVDDFSAHLMKQDGWTVLNLPAMTEIDRDVVIGPRKTYRWLAGEALHPARLSVDELMKMKANYHGAQALIWAAQYMGNPIPAEGALIERKWFKIYVDAPTPLPGDIVVQSWDTAYKVGSRNDYSACLTFRCRGDQYFLIDAYRGRLDYLALKSKIAAHAVTFGANVVLVEEAALGDALIKSLSAGGSLKPIAIKPNGSKEERVIRQIAPLAGGQVLLPERAPWLPDFMAEALAFPGAAYDDQVDALSQFLEWIEEKRRRARQKIGPLGGLSVGGGQQSPFGSPESVTLGRGHQYRNYY